MILNQSCPGYERKEREWLSIVVVVDRCPRFMSLTVNGTAVIFFYCFMFYNLLCYLLCYLIRVTRDDVSVLCSVN